MRLQSIQTNFSAGEISPRLLSRTDLSKYQNGVSRLDNLIVQQHGGIVRRPGTKFVACSKNNKVARLVPFQYSTTETYVIEFTSESAEGFCRFYRDGGQVQYSDSATAIPVTHTVAAGGTYNSGTDTITINGIETGCGYSVGDRVTTAGFLPAGYNVTDALVTAVYPGVTDSISFKCYTDPGAATTSGGAGDIGTVDGPYTISSPYTTDEEINQFRYTQSSDILFIVSPSDQPKELQRTGVDQFAITDYMYKDGPYLDINDDKDKTINTTALVATGSQSVSGSGGVLPGTGAAYINRAFRFKGKATKGGEIEWGWGYITAIVDVDNFTVLVEKAIENPSTDMDEWRLGAWGEGDWPRSVMFHQQRLWFANTTSKPQTLWGTVIGGIATFSPSELDSGVQADDAGLDWTIYDLQANSIYWLVSMSRGLVLFTSNGEYLLLSTSSSDSLTPTNVGVFKHSTWGISEYIEPKHIGPASIFVQKAKRKVREFSYAFDQDQFKAMDMTLLAEHITSGLVKQIEYQQEPSGTIWAITESGGLLSMTYERDQELYGWADHQLGGADVKVKSMTSIFENTEDRLWMCVERTINDVSAVFIEYLTPQFDTDDDVADAFFVDAGLTYSGPATDVLAGLEHLAGTTDNDGEMVDILVDGAAHPQMRVTSSGTLQLQVEGTKIHVGLPYTSRVDSLPLFALRAPFETRGRFVSVHSALLNFHQTVGAKAGPDENNLDIIAFREGSDLMDTSLTPFTGAHELYLNSKYNQRPVMVVTQEQPLPFTLLGITYRLDVNEA